MIIYYYNNFKHLSENTKATKLVAHFFYCLNLIKFIILFI